MDLLAESYYVLVPWRWVMGAHPFAPEQNVLQMAGLLEYPFLKLFGLLRGNDPTGVVLYARHLYLLLMVAVAAASFLLLRRLVCWQLALLIATAVMTYVQRATPQLDYNTMGMAFLTLGGVLGAWVVVRDKGWAYAAGSGVAFACAVVAYPTLIVAAPFVGVFFVIAQAWERREGVDRVAPRSAGARGRRADSTRWRMLVAWLIGGALVLVPVGLLLVSFGLTNVRAGVEGTVSSTEVTGQLGGAEKVAALVSAVRGFLTGYPLVLAVLALVYLVYRRWPRRGRQLLGGVPLLCGWRHSARGWTPPATSLRTLSWLRISTCSSRRPGGGQECDFCSGSGSRR